MKALRIILIVLLVLFGGFVILNAALPRDVEVSRVRVMNDSPEAIYGEISDLKNWSKWSTYFDIDPNAQYDYSTPSGGVGAWYRWSSENPNLGIGKLTVVETEEPRAMRTQIEFEGMGIVDGSWSLVPVAAGTEVVWTAHMEFPFFKRLKGLRMDAVLGPQFEEGLANLDSVASLPEYSTAPDFDFKKVEMEEKMIYYVALNDISMADIETYRAEGFGALVSWLGEDAAEMERPMCEFTNWDEENQTCAFRTLVVADTDKAASPPIMEGVLVGGLYMKGVRYGVLKETKDIYSAAEDQSKKMGWKIVGEFIEQYITDPSMEPDTSKWITHIYWPIALASDNIEG